MSTPTPNFSNPQRRERFLNLAEFKRTSQMPDSLPPIVEAQSSKESEDESDSRDLKAKTDS